MFTSTCEYFYQDNKRTSGSNTIILTKLKIMLTAQFWVIYLLDAHKKYIFELRDVSKHLDFFHTTCF